jgi:hypothetical protein
MNDRHEPSSVLNTNADRVCRVAYTLDNFQPVMSTIIGDQPFFYMDCEEAIIEDDDDDLLILEEGLLSLEDYQALEKELLSFKEQESALTRFQEDFLRTAEQYFDDYCTNKNDLLGHHDTTDTRGLEAVLEVFSQSRLGKAYLDFARQNGIDIRYSNQVSGATYQPQSQSLLIHSDLCLEDQILLLARELRRCWQIRRMGALNVLSFGPDQAILLNRLKTADLQTAMIRIGWELQLSGERRVWKRIETSSLSDLGGAFAREAFLDFRSLNNGNAAVAVFEQWFLSARCKLADKEVIHDMLGDNQDYVFKAPVIEDEIKAETVMALGSMPFGKNYLATHVQTLLNDPLFREVKDRSNANFLWFVKFERSFREMEQELQDTPVPAADAVRASGSHTANNGVHTDETHTADILQFCLDKRASKRTRRRSDVRSNGTHASADIIYLRRWCFD